jgi:hypothetical protein
VACNIGMVVIQRSSRLCQPSRWLLFNLAPAAEVIYRPSNQKTLNYLYKKSVFNVVSASRRIGLILFANCCQSVANWLVDELKSTCWSNSSNFNGWSKLGTSS